MVVEQDAGVGEEGREEAGLELGIGEVGTGRVGDDGHRDGGDGRGGGRGEEVAAGGDVAKVVLLDEILLAVVERTEGDQAQVAGGR